MEDKQKFQIADINPEPIGVLTLPIEKHLEYKSEILSIFSNPSEKLTQQFPSEPFTKHICNMSHQNIFNSFPKLNELKVEINNLIINFITEIGFLCDEVVISSAWLNNASKGAVLASHFHSNSYVSGNYFVNFDSINHSPLSFENDRSRAKDENSIVILENMNNKTPYSVETVSIKAKEGQILVWRSNMKHGYKVPNKTDNRITLSFNSLPKILDNGRYTVMISG
tara:strand:- start:18673 stop:19347 length:675 start_codon:yes stop_codon:yes gene_type:complete